MVITKEHRALARERDHYLVKIFTDGGERRQPEGALSFTGPLSPECHDELWAMVKRWLEEGKV